MLFKSKVQLTNKRNLKNVVIQARKHYPSLSDKEKLQIKSLSNLTSSNDQSTRIKSEQMNLTSTNCIKRDILYDYSLSQSNDQLTSKNFFINPMSIMKFPIKHIIISKPKIKSISQQHQDSIITNCRYKGRNNQLLLKIKKELYNKVKDKDNSENDIVNCEDLYTNNLKRKVRDSLIADFNFSANNEFIMERDQFYAQFDNKVNFVEDIFLVPHLMNKLGLNNYDFNNNNDTGKESLIHTKTPTQRILQAHCLCKQLMLSMNKEKRRLQYEKDNKRSKKNYRYFAKAKGNVIIDPNLEYHYDIESYFIKLYHYKQISFANQKVKDVIYSLNK